VRKKDIIIITNQQSEREREREREKVEVGRELDWIFWRKQNTTSKTHFKARWELRGA
jgi:hypothetical protein